VIRLIPFIGCILLRIGGCEFHAARVIRPPVEGCMTGVLIGAGGAATGATFTGDGGKVCLSGQIGSGRTSACFEP
jgi:hypothetical protein